MNLHTVEIATIYGSLGIYGLGVLGFFLFALSFIGTSFKHFIATALLSVIWPIFIAVALIRQGRKVKSGAVKYVAMRTK